MRSLSCVVAREERQTSSKRNRKRVEQEGEAGGSVMPGYTRIQAGIEEVKGLRVDCVQGR